MASVSRKGVLAAKKAGTAYITAKYKGKTSKKLKVVVESDPETGNPADPGNTYNPGGSSGDYTITYDKNSSKGCKLNGPASQSGSGEILKFSTTVIPASGKKFLGWYDAPTGGNRIYETYKPSGNMTLYAHYTDENTQQVTFSLGCEYGSTYEFMSKHAPATGNSHWRDFNWNDQSCGGPFDLYEAGNVTWKHTYPVSSDKKHFTVDDLPTPEIPGYTFIGWYTTNQGKKESAFAGKKVDSNTEINTSVTELFARYSKKLTISFDDLRGGTYDDIVVDTYQSIADCGQKLPTVSLIGATFLGWAMDADNHTGWSSCLPMVTKDSKFLNCAEWYGYMCSGCAGMGKHYIVGNHNSDCSGGGVNDDWHIYEDTDHITLYPVYKFHKSILSFDPNGGEFPVGSYENNKALMFDDERYDVDNSYISVGKFIDQNGGHPYGNFYIPGQGDNPDAELYGIKYGNGHKNFPLVRKQNYVFDKWVYTDTNGNEQELTLETMITGNMMFHAKWVPGRCNVRFEQEDGTITKEEQDRCGLTAWNSYYVTTESTISGDGKKLPVPVSSEGREFVGWYTKDGEEVTKDTKITKDTTLYARWGTKTESKPETQKPSIDKDNSVNKDTDSNNKNETVHATDMTMTDMTMTDMEWKPVDKTNNHYTVEYGGKGNQTGLSFTLIRKYSQ